MSATTRLSAQHCSCYFPSCRFQSETTAALRMHTKKAHQKVLVGWPSIDHSTCWLSVAARLAGLVGAKPSGPPAQANHDVALWGTVSPSLAQAAAATCSPALLATILPPDHPPRDLRMPLLSGIRAFFAKATATTPFNISYDRPCAVCPRYAGSAKHPRAESVVVDAVPIESAGARSTLLHLKDVPACLKLPGIGPRCPRCQMELAPTLPNFALINLHSSVSLAIPTSGKWPEAVVAIVEVVDGCHARTWFPTDRGIHGDDGGFIPAEPWASIPPAERGHIALVVVEMRRFARTPVQPPTTVRVALTANDPIVAGSPMRREPAT